MAVDLEAIARRANCDVSALKNALTPLEQGYSPSFLARYRRDELGGLDEASLWAVAAGVELDQSIDRQREELLEKWNGTALSDPALGAAIKKAHSKKMLLRLSRRLKKEDSGQASDVDRVAVRLLNPTKGDSAEIAELCSSLEIADASSVEKEIDTALANRLHGDPRMINAAVRWLAKNAKIHIVSIQDPHKPGQDPEADDEAKADAKPAAVESAESAGTTTKPESEDSDSQQATEAEVAQATTEAESTTETEAAHEAGSPVAEESVEPAAETPAADAEAVAAEPAVENQLTPEAGAESSDPVVEVPGDSVASGTAEAGESGESSDSSNESSAESSPSTTSGENPAEESIVESAVATVGSGTGEAVADTKPAAKGKKEPKAEKKNKKISPRQRRRRWLVSVLKPLEGKRMIASKVSSFQIVMLGRALRSQVATCIFEYDANKLVQELQKSAAGINRKLEAKLKEIVLEHEANIREAAETAWWDELHERASGKLLGIAADQLREHINRGAVEAKVVMSIDAVGPRTAATTIVSADGRVVHCEDLPCQMSGTLRAQTVNKMGELIHAHHVDLIVISNGPARRSSMIALSDLIKQSPEGSIRYTLADRSGADAYASSDIANQEMRATPRRFRASAWLAFSVLQPAQAYAKIDPLKLRLASFQRELSDDALASALESVMISGASRGGVDANSASKEWLARLPGMNAAASQQIDQHRRNELWKSRQELLDSDTWDSSVHSRQAIAFLRVFGSDEVLDGTLIHPDDYALAKKLAKALSIELPPASPPGYKTPSFAEETVAETTLTAEERPVETPAIEDVSAEVEKKAADSFAEEVKLAPEAENSEDSVTDGEVVAEPSVEASEGSAAPDVGAEEPQTESTETPEAESASESAASEPQESAVEESAASDVEASANDESAASAEEVHEPIRRPRPDRAQIEKCIKEWQVGKQRVNQLVNWLCDPFGDSDASSRPPAVLKSIPTLKQLSPGDEVIGVVVGVVGFGVFVELAPDCNGLIHVSKVSDRFVEDLHEAIQVGDVVTTWVTGIDEKKRRVALSAVSPEREQELKNQRESQRAPRGRGGDRGGPRGGGDRQRGRRGDGKPSGQSQQGRGGGRPQSRGGGGGRSERGGRRDNRGAGGGRPRGKKPETYRVVSKAVSAPISEAMQKGEEPLRSFGDLMQFFKKEEPQVKEAAVEPTGNEPAPSEPATDVVPAADTSGVEVTENAPPVAEDSDASSGTENVETAPQETPTDSSQDDSGDTNS